MRMINGQVILLIIIFYSTMAVGVEIEVVALFKDAALIKIDGNQQLLKVGRQSKRGVRLVSATSKEAIVEYDGQQREFNLSNRISSTFTAGESTIVPVMIKSESGRYRTSGSINGHPVDFLVDTGANIVAMGTPHAKRLGLNLSKGRKGHAETAGGRVTATYLTVRSISIGQILVSNVGIAVLEGNPVPEILLGQTFLSQINMSQSGGVMTMTQ